MAAESFEPITKSNHSAYLILTVWASFFSTLLFWVVRIVYRWRRIGLKKDDAFLIPAMGLALAQSICLQFAVNAGLGKRDNAEHNVHLDEFQKLFYASNLLNILCQASSKLSVALLVDQLQPFRAYRVANYASLALIAGWAIASFLALAFECQVPNPWHFWGGRCLNLRKLFLGIDITNIISEAILIVIPGLLMPQVETTNSIRFTVAGCFAARLGVIAALGAHIYTLSSLTDIANASFSFTLPAIWFQVVMAVSLLTACIPGAQHILSELRTGLLAINVESDSPDASRYGSVFGTNSDNLRTYVSRNDDAKTWEMAKTHPGSGLRSTDKTNEGTDTDSERWLTGRAIAVFKEVNQAEEFQAG